MAAGALATSDIIRSANDRGEGGAEALHVLADVLGVETLRNDTMPALQVPA